MATAPFYFDNRAMRWAPFTSRLLAAVAYGAANIERALWPVSCVFCGYRQQPEVPVCTGCHSDLPWSAACHPALAPLTLTIAPFEYAFPIDVAIKAMKFKRRLFYAPAFGHLLMQTIATLPDDVDALMPVPLHWRRHAMRGFNQAAEIARPIHAATGLPLVANVTRRHTPYQSGLTAAQRKRNLKSAFLVRGTIDYRHVLIIDDVITTGQTCCQLARVLLDAGAKQVSALVIAQATRD